MTDKKVLFMKCGYDNCDKVRKESATGSVMDHGIMRNGVWYCSHVHYEEQVKVDWHKKSNIDYKRKCRNLNCFNMKPVHFWEKLKKGEGFEKNGYWYCSTECYEADVKREWHDERERYISLKFKDRIRKIKFGALLLQADVITPEQLEDALEHSKRTKRRIGESLLELGFISEEHLTGILSKQEGIPKIDLDRATLKPEVTNLLNKEQAKKYMALPIEVLKRTNTLILAIADPSNKLGLIDLKYITGYSIEPFIVPESSLKSALRRYYNITDEEFDKMSRSAKKESVTEIKEKKLTKDDLGELKSAVNSILSGAKAKGAGDFDLSVVGDSIKGSFKYGDVICEVSFTKIKGG